MTTISISITDGGTKSVELVRTYDDLFEMDNQDWESEVHTLVTKAMSADDDRVLDTCEICEDSKKVDIGGDTEKLVPCPECQKGFYGKDDKSDDYRNN